MCGSSPGNDSRSCLCFSSNSVAWKQVCSNKTFRNSDNASPDRCRLGSPGFVGATRRNARLPLVESGEQFARFQSSCQPPATVAYRGGAAAMSLKRPRTRPTPKTATTPSDRALEASAAIKRNDFDRPARLQSKFCRRVIWRAGVLSLHDSWAPGRGDDPTFLLV